MDAGHGAMLCGSCGSENVDGRSFCGKCGTALKITGEVCAARNGADKKFCSSGGKSLGGQSGWRSTPSPPAASRPIPESIANGRYLMRRMLGEGASKIV